MIRTEVGTVIRVPGTPRPSVCNSYDDALAQGKEVARRNGVDLWAIDGADVHLIARRPERTP